jgi:hypothetical protein
MRGLCCFMEEEGPWLPDLDSNQDKQSQSLSYYHYTIRQFSDKEIISFIFGCKDNLDLLKPECKTEEIRRAFYQQTNNFLRFGVSESGK